MNRTDFEELRKLCKALDADTILPVSVGVLRDLFDHYVDVDVCCVLSTSAFVDCYAQEKGEACFGADENCKPNHDGDFHALDVCLWDPRAADCSTGTSDIVRHASWLEEGGNFPNPNTALRGDY